MNRAACAVALFVGASGCVLMAGPHARTAPALERGTPPTDRFLELGGAWVRVRDSGVDTGRTPLVLVHGYASRLESWAAVQPALAENRRVVSLDQRGFGMSERPRGAYGPAAHARDVRALADKLGLVKPVLVGHSYGGGVVLRAALDDPERWGGLILVDAFAMDEQLPSAFRWAKVPVLGEFVFSTQFKEVIGEKYILAFHDRGRFANADAIDEFRGNTLRPGSLYALLNVVRGMDYGPDQVRYRELGLPSVIIWGEDDRVTPLAAGKQLAALVDGARFEVLPACGHVPLWERPQAVIRIVEELLGKIDRSRAARERRTTTPAAGSATP
ncbi:MAG: alpha/beta hydrolase [Deltaproteobacteria bacterium]|nr:alpha/beta hydrolase [Deltaproteobacteria bacterium]